MAKEKEIRFTLRIPAKLKKLAAKDASINKRSLNQHIVYAIEMLTTQGSKQASATVETS